MINDELKKKIDSLPSTDKDDVYRYLWHSYVAEDIERQAEGRGLTLDKEDIDCLADKYVYDGKYDCNLDYWANIDNLLDGVSSDLNV